MPPQRDAFGRLIEQPREPAAVSESVDADEAVGSEIDELRRIIADELAKGEPAAATEQDRVALAQLQEVQRLIDLHAAGTIDDDALEAAIAAMTPAT